MKNFINFIVDENDNNKRIDLVITEKFNKLSRSKVKSSILSGNLKINSKMIIDPAKKIKTLDNIFFQSKEEEKFVLEPYNYELNIVYEDEDLIVINKDAGMSIHPGAGNYDKTLVNALININKRKLSSIGDKYRPGIVHRIDKNTSGLIVIAKNDRTHSNLSEQFKNHSVDRIYISLVWGKLRPQNGRIENLIRRSNKNRKLMEIGLTKGKKAITNYKTLKLFENKNIPTFSLLECKLETGRTHQIRVQLSNLGNHILGDDKYKKKFKKIKNIDESLNNDLNNLKRQFLHAKTLGFIHPIKGKKLNFNSELPVELDKILKKLSKYSK